MAYTNDFARIMELAWNLMCTELTLYGFTFSYGQIFIYLLLTILVCRGIFYYLWG